MTGIEEVAAVSAIVAAGATVYTATQAGNLPNAPKLAQAPKLPDTKPAAASIEQGELQAKTAGGTLLSKSGQPQIGDSANAVRKTLLGQ